MTNDEVLRFLMAVAGYVAQLHGRGPEQKEPQETNAGPRFDAEDIPAEEEGFARWMGWRGPEEQEKEIRKQRGL